METAQIVALRSPGQRRPNIRIEAETIVVEQLRVTDRSLAAFVETRTDEQRLELIERALRIGLLALQDAGTSLDVDFVRREFDALLQRSASANAQAAQALDQVLRANFADQDGRLPRTLERFLGDRGQLNRFVSELFDEQKRDSAIGRMRALLGTYFDGDASRVAQLLDPTRLGSPLYQFRTEVSQAFAALNERLTAIEAAQATRLSERGRSAAKGIDFEDVLEELLCRIVGGTADVVDRIGVETGDLLRSRKGDFLLTLDPRLCRGGEVRVVIEAKDRQISTRQIREELQAAKRNRDAAVALAIFTPAHAPAGIEPFDVRAGDVYCVIDPAAPDVATLGAAVRLARLHALASLVDSTTEIDAGRIAHILGAIKGELDALRRLKMQLTSISTAASDVAGGLDRLREQVLTRVAEAEAQLAPARQAS